MWRRILLSYLLRWIILHIDPEKKDEGEKCKVNFDCKSNNCNKGKCVYLEDGDHCEKNFECGKASSCKDNVCTPLAEEGEACTSDYECGFNLACGNGKCQKMFTLENGAKSDWQLPIMQKWICY